MKSNVFKGCLWMIGGVFSLTSMAVAGKEISFELSTFEIMLYRSIIGFSLILIVCIASNSFKEITTKNIKLHFIRNVAHFTGQNLWFYALAYIPLAQVFALEFTMPIWIIIFSLPLLGEQITKVKVFSVILGFIGILTVTRPDVQTIDWQVGAAALSAIAFALTTILTRKLTDTESVITILFYLTSMQLLFALIVTGYDGVINVPSERTLPWLVLIGFGGLTAHYCITTALSYAPPSIISPIDFARLPLVALIGILFYNEPLDLFVILGGIIIFFANWINLTNNSNTD